MKSIDYDRAEAYYRKWFVEMQGCRNPTDVNTLAKFNFAMSVGWEVFSDMQTCRKRGLDFTRKEYYERDEVQV